MCKNLCKNISTNLSGKYNQKILDHTKQSGNRNTCNFFKKSLISKTAKDFGDFIGNEITDKITRVSKTSPKNNSITNEEEMLREKNIPTELRQKIIDDLRLKKENYWWSKINIIMEYQKIIHMFDNTPNQPSKFRTKNWVEVNDESRGTYNVNSQIKSKTLMILVSVTITVPNTAAAGAAANNRKKDN